MRLLGWGIVIYAIMMFAYSLLVVYGLAGSLTARIIELLVLIVTTTIAGQSLRMHSWLDILPYSLSWAAMMIFFDAAFNAPSATWQFLSDWNAWFGYTLVAVVPLFTMYRHAGHDARHSSHV